MSINPDNPPGAPERAAADPEQAARDNAKALIKDVILEIIAEREAAPPKGKKVDILHTLFGGV
jgi:hypothetical protein